MVKRHQFRSLRSVVAVLAGSALLLSACGSSSSSDSTEAPATEAPRAPSDSGPAKDGAGSVALMMTGSINDGGWNQAGYEGLARLEAAGLKTAYTENIQQADMQSVAEGYANDGFDLVIGHGFEFGTTVSELAPQYPDTNFFATTFAPDLSAELPPNLTFLDPQYFAAAYAAGALAGMESTSKIVGIVGGGDNPTQRGMIAAFRAGAESIDGVKALDVLTGTYEDPQKGREAAVAMVGQGADVILHVANATGLGAIAGATEKGAEVIGYYQNQTELAPDLMLTSLQIKLDDMVEFLGTTLGTAEYPAGQEWHPEPSFMWTPVYGDTDHNSDLVDDATWTAFETLFEEINAGKVEIPTS